jgi:hypothetical protein
MKRIIFVIVTALFCSCEKNSQNLSISKQTDTIPEHIIFIWFENKNYSQIINSDSAPYINSLIPEGALFTNFHALGHPSYPEYLRFFSGTDNGKTNDACLKGAPYNSPNLYTQLKAKEKTFAWYSEDLPAIGSDTCSSGAYVERHNPTQCFSNVPGSANKRLVDFPKNFSELENVVCISPNLNNDMHDGSILQGDTWLKNHLAGLIEWCKNHNSVFVIYFDEDNGTAENRIPVIALGQNIKNNYKSDVNYNHYNWTRTILQEYGGDQIANSAKSRFISDCWKKSEMPGLK